MADVKIQDVNLTATPDGSNKVPVSDGSGLAKTISVDQIIGVHENKTDPHTQYAETSELGTAAYEDTTAFQANGIIVTDGDGNSYLANDGTYKAVSSGTTDHGALSGLGDDDHTQYLNETRHDLLDHTGLTGIPDAYTLPTASTTTLGGVKVDGTTVTITDGVISSTATGGVTDHGVLTGLADDDHTQYLNETRHDLLDHSGLTGIPSITGLLDETAHDLLDHTGLTGIPTAYTDEMAQDAVGAAIVAGTQSGITVTYDDANNKIDFTVTATGTGDVTGPAGSVDSNFALFNGTTGKVIKDGGVKASDFATASHNHTGVYQPAGTYSTDIHSNITALNAVSGTNTGDQFIFDGGSA